jgi:RecB family exonuclease
MPVAAMLPYGEPVFRVLEVMIREAKRDDPLAPVTVVVPSNFTGLSLRRRLGVAGGVVNVRFLVFARMAELFGAARLSGMRPLTPWRRAEAIRAALTGDAGVFQGVAQHAATESALDATFRDLRGASEDALDHLAAESLRGKSVVKLYRRFRQLTANTFDEETLAVSAASAVREGSGALRDLGHVVLFLPRSFSPGERSLVHELVRRDAADFVFGATFDPQADEATVALATDLGASVPPGALDGTPVTATRVLRAIDTEEEVRTVVRLILDAAATGTPLYRAGVLYPSADSYAPLLLEQFAAAGIPVNGPAVRPLAASMAGRVLLRMLELPDEDFRREAVMEWLTSGPIVETQHGDAAGRRVPAARWDEISRDAGVVKGLAQWRTRLDGWIKAERHAPRERDAEAAERLAAFVEELDQNLQTPRHATSEALGRWALGLLDRYLGSEAAAAGGWGNDAEAAAYQDLRKRLDAIAVAGPLRDPETGTALSPIARVEPAETRRAFARALEAVLAPPGGRLGRFGDGVFVGPVVTARGMGFDHVFVLGMVEGSMPAATREDPLLTEDERDGASLPRRDVRRLDARGDYLAALASAPERTLCFPQSSLGEQAKRVPSRWLLESASALAGVEVPAERLAEIRLAPWLTGVESFEHALGSERFPAASAQEWELRSLLRQPDAHAHFLAAEPSFAASVEAATVRLPSWSRRHPLAGAPAPLSPWAGGVGPGVSVDSARVYSPTSFETLATCAYRYFLTNVIRVKETERPAGVVRISPADRGNVIHDSLERFLREVHDAGRSPAPGTPWTSSDAARLLQIGDEECDAAHRRGITGSELLWHVDRARIRRDLSLFLGADSAARKETRATFADAEWPFEKAVITLDDGRELAFRGRVDRVDRAEDGTLIVYDYKTGAADGFEKIAKGDDPLGAGTRLQLPIYAVAVREALGDGTASVQASYWFASEREKFRRIGYTLEPGHEDALRATLGVLAGTVEAGAFLAVPGKQDRDSYQNCRFCPYDRVCGAGDRARAFEERKGAPGLAAYVALSEPTQ